MGLQAAPADQIQLLRAFTASRWQIFRMARVLHALPYIFAGLDVSIVQDFLFENNVIDKKIAPESFVIASPGFFEKVDNYDHEEVIRQARACKLN